MENMEKVLEFNRKAEDTMEWFFKLLDEEKIPHEEEIREAWGGSGRQPKYEQNIIVYVPREHKEKVESYLKEYSNPNNIVHEEYEELKNVSNEEEEENKEYNKRNIAQKILILIPFVMVAIVILCGIISSIIY